MQETKDLLWQIAGKENWDALEQVDGWLFVFDRLPPRMRITLDYRVQGLSNKEISGKMGISIKAVQKNVRQVKKRVLEFIL